MKNCILSTAYFGNIQYFTKLLLYENIFIEKYENYQKQSFRNRFEIQSANGNLTLSIPVKKSNELKTPISEVCIDYTENWQKNHLKALESAYKNSPYYEYYIDDFIDFLNKKHENLLEHNTQLTHLIAKTIGIKTKIEFTQEFFPIYENSQDFRNSIHPKTKMQKIDTYFQAVKYYQVFENKFPFAPNLSILDLIFNEGPRTKEILELSTKKAQK